MLGLTTLVSAAISICTTIGNTLGPVGAFIAKTATTLGPYINKIANVLNTVGTILNIFQPNDKAENFGEAMRQAKQKPEDFDKISSYIDYLRSEINSNKIDFNATKTPEDKLANQLMGYGLLIQGINEKYNLVNADKFWETMGNKSESNKINAHDISAIVENLGKSKILADNVAKYINGNELSENKSQISNLIENSLKVANPQMSDSEITSKFNELIKD